MRRHLNAFHAPAHVPRMSFVEQVIHAGMNLAGGLKNRMGFVLLVWLPNFIHVQDGEHHAFSVAQRNFGATGFESFRKLFCDVERDRHRPNHAAGEPHVLTDALVLGAGHEATQRRESATHQQFQITDLARSQIPGRPLARMGFQFASPVRIDNEINEFAAVRRDKMAC